MSSPSSAAASRFITTARAAAKTCTNVAAKSDDGTAEIVNTEVAGVPKTPGAAGGFSQRIIVSPASDPKATSTVQELDYQVSRFVVIIDATRLSVTKSTSIGMVPTAVNSFATSAGKLAVTDVIKD